MEVYIELSDKILEKMDLIKKIIQLKGAGYQRVYYSDYQNLIIAEAFEIYKVRFYLQLCRFWFATESSRIVNMSSIITSFMRTDTINMNSFCYVKWSFANSSIIMNHPILAMVVAFGRNISSTCTFTSQDNKHVEPGQEVFPATWMDGWSKTPKLP